MNNLLRLTVVVVLLAFTVFIFGLGMARNTSDMMAPFNLLLFVVAVALYLFPTALAYYRDCKATVWIAIVNVFLGWTIAGWFVAIGWAATGKAETSHTSIAAPPGQAIPGH